MKLRQNPVKDSSRRGCHYFTIENAEPGRLERVEEALCATECSFSIGGDGALWGDFCDGCPCYNDGFSSGFWIKVEHVEEFKAAYKSVKGIK